MNTPKQVRSYRVSVTLQVPPFISDSGRTTTMGDSFEFYKSAKALEFAKEVQSMHPTANVSVMCDYYPPTPEQVWP